MTWKGRSITSQAKEFVTGCLQKDPEKRWSAKQALENLQVCLVICKDDNKSASHVYFAVTLTFDRRIGLQLWIRFGMTGGLK